MGVARFYTRAVVVPAVLIVAGQLLFHLVYTINSQEYNSYKSEYFGKESAVWMPMLLAILNAGFVCLLSLSLLLTSYKAIKRSRVLNLTSWFLAPGCWIGYLLAKDGADAFVLINTVPYAVGLAYAYIECRRGAASVESSRLATP